MSLFQQIFAQGMIEPVGLIAAAASLVASLAAKFLGNTLARQKEATTRFYLNGVVPAVDDQVRARLEEAKTELSRQGVLIFSNRVMSVTLTIGHYIIGGVLASSFVQESLPRSSVGLLGVLVLISSLIQQHFRPDLEVASAKHRAIRLRALIREAQDDVVAAQSAEPGALTMVAICRKISESLSVIEQLELKQIEEKKKKA